ncbi:hypothetical protein [Actinokineospora spheciospongiae]|uniref:hypothetical protein n=1 Tax=Actinokineospora spheciospongiae TaxID=909613 RepID=UPI00126787AF|nr:hypothetical protein [Actinokineospora spheciospongiae]
MERGGSPWSTVRAERLLVIAVHNVTAATRLVDVLPLIAGDSRVQVRFAVTGSSAFTDGTAGFLSAMGADPVDWTTAVELRPDLVISASHGGDLREPGAPVIIFPHGVGYNKYLDPGTQEPRNPGTQEPRNPGTPVFGLSPEWLLDADGGVIPSVLVLSHAEQVDRLASACPKAVPVAVVAGDPCLDRILASLPLRAVYRSALGADGRTVVVVSSTWGRESLFGTDPGFVARLAARLPVDRYRVVLALHPNISAHHSRWQVETWLRECARAGVVVLDPVEGWRAALVAADLVIGDHGSVSLYAAAAGRPLALAVAPESTVDPNSAIGRMLAVAPRIAVDDDVAARVDELAGQPVPPELAAVAELASSGRGESARLLRTALYDLIDLPEPPEPADATAVPVPPPVSDRGRSHLVTATIVAVTEDSAEVELVRYPAPRLEDWVGGSAHLVVGLAEPYRRWLDLAEVVVVDRSPADAAAVLASLPGCLLAAVSDGPPTVLTADGTRVRFTEVTGDGDPHPETAALCASAVHCWLVDGRALAELPRLLRLWVGGRVRRVEVGELAG